MAGSGSGTGSETGAYESVSINDSAVGFQTNSEGSGDSSSSTSAMMGGTGWGEEVSVSSSYDSDSDSSTYMSNGGSSAYSDVNASQVNLNDSYGAQDYEVIQDEPECLTLVYNSTSGFTETTSGETATTVGYPVEYGLFSYFHEVPVDFIIEPYGVDGGDLGPAEEFPSFALVYHPDTNRMIGIASDGVSRSGPPAPTATLIALAAAGRNPTDITIPTIGSEGSGDDEGDGGGDAIVAGGSTAGQSSTSASESSGDGSGTQVASAGAASRPTGSSTTATAATSASASGPTAESGTSSDGTNSVTYAAAGRGSTGTTDSSTSADAPALNSTGQSAGGGVDTDQVEAQDESRRRAATKLRRRPTPRASPRQLLSTQAGRLSARSVDRLDAWPAMEREC